MSRFFLHEYDVLLQRLQPALDVCGSIPRPCLRAAQSADDLSAAQSDIRTAISAIKDVAAVLERVHGNDDRLIPHRLFEIYPASDSKAWECCNVRTVSQWAFDQLVVEMETRDEHAAHKLYKQIQGTVDAAEFRGRLWERQVHKFFRSISARKQFHIHSLPDRDDSLIIEFSSAVSHQTFGPIQMFTGLLNSSVKDHKSSYLKPLNKNFATFDSFLYQPGLNDSQGVQPLLGIQITDAGIYDIGLRGLQTLQTACKPQIPDLNTLRPSAERKWIILFIVPAPMGASFQSQNIKPPSEHWKSKTVQYILELPVEEVWNLSR